MLTPWGALENLDLHDHEICRSILAADKHQLAEGLVVENLFDQIIDGVPGRLEGAVVLDVDTAIVNGGPPDNQWYAFVWARSKQPGLGRYLIALEKQFRVWLVETDVPLTTFTAREWRDGSAVPGRRPLPDIMMSPGQVQNRWLFAGRGQDPDPGRRHRRKDR